LPWLRRHLVSGAVRITHVAVTSLFPARQPYLPNYKTSRQKIDRKAKVRRFKVDDLVYLYNPSVKLGLTKKFSRPWTGSYRITKRLSELNYEILGQNNKKQVVHINRLKSCNLSSWKPRTKRDPVKSRSKTPPARVTEEYNCELQIKSFPLPSASHETSCTERDVPQNQTQPDASPDEPTLT
jgi:hypothetical protein